MKHEFDGEKFDEDIPKVMDKMIEVLTWCKDNNIHPLAHFAVLVKHLVAGTKILKRAGIATSVELEIITNDIIEEHGHDDLEFLR